MRTKTGFLKNNVFKIILVLTLITGLTASATSQQTALGDRKITDFGDCTNEQGWNFTEGNADQYVYCPFGEGGNAGTTPDVYNSSLGWDTDGNPETNYAFYDRNDTSILAGQTFGTNIGNSRSVETYYYLSETPADNTGARILFDTFSGNLYTYDSNGNSLTTHEPFEYCSSSNISDCRLDITLFPEQDKVQIDWNPNEGSPYFSNFSFDGDAGYQYVGIADQEYDGSYSLSQNFGYSNLTYDHPVIINLEPTLDSINTDPSNPLDKDNVDLQVDVSDDNNDISNVEVDVWEGNTKILNDKVLSDVDGDFTFNGTNFEVDSQYTYTINATATDGGGLTDSKNATFDVDPKPPEIDLINRTPEIGNSNRLDKYDLDIEGSRGTYDVDNVTVVMKTYYDTQSGGAVKDNYIKTFETSKTGSTIGDSFYVNETDAFDVKKEYEGNQLSFAVKPTDVNGNKPNEFRSTVNVDGAEYVSIYNEPSLTLFDADPDIPNAETGDQFDLTVEGDTGDKSISNLTFSMSVKDATDPSDVFISNLDYTDSASFNHFEENVFEMLSKYDGKEITLKASVSDSLGYSGTSTLSGFTEEPPKQIIQNNPEDNDVFLIPEGDSSTEVSYEYGVETSNHGGTVELIVDNTVVDSFSVTKNTLKTVYYNKSYTSGTYDWKVRYEDNVTNTNYNSSTRSFDVSDEPFNLRLDNPSSNEEISVKSGNSTDIDHKFEIDARATPEDFYYRFLLDNKTSGDNLVNRTSGTLNIDVQSFTETVQDLEQGEYEYTVKIFMESDNSLQESGSSSYTIKKDPLFDISIDRPFDGESYSVNGSNDETDVNSTYSVETYNQDVDVTYTLDGVTIDSRTISSGNSASIDEKITNLSTGTYELGVIGKDSFDRTNSDNITFYVESNVPKIDQVIFEPSLNEVTVGEEVDVTLHGSGVPEDVDFVEYEITSNGETVDTVKIDADKLKETGSWTVTVDNAFTVTQDIIDQGIKFVGDVFGINGSVTSYVKEFFGLGSEASIDVTLNNPVDGETFRQVDGDVKDIRFNFDVTTLDNAVDWNLRVKHENNSVFDSIDTGTVTSTDSTNEVQVYHNLNESVSGNYQFGTFDWEVWINDTQNNESDESFRNSFSIEQNSSEPVLNFYKPRDNTEIKTETGLSVAEVDFFFDVETFEESDVKLKIYDDAVNPKPTVIYDEQLNGFDQKSLTQTFDNGTYKAVLEVDSSNYYDNVTRTFSIVNEPLDENQADIELRKPSDNRNLYQNQGNPFEWRVFSNKSGYSTIYIEDSNDNVVETFNRTYDTQNEVLSYQEIYDTDLNIGSYTWHGEFVTGSNLITTSDRSFEVVDYKEPETVLKDPLNKTFTTKDNIKLEWSTQTFESNAEVILKVREKGNYQSTEIATYNQDSNIEKNYNESISRSAGTYEWFVQKETNPTWKSAIGTFSVEDSNIKDPDISLINPEQGDRYELNGSDNTSVSFDYEVEVFSETESTVKLQLKDQETDEDYKTINSDKQISSEGLITYNHSEVLNESGYTYKVVVEDPNGDVVESDEIGFAVGNADIPDPEAEKGFTEKITSWVGDQFDKLNELIGSTGLFFLASFLSMFIGIATFLLTNSSELSLINLIIGVFFFIYIEWYPSWLGMILFFISAGIFVWMVRKTAVGGD